MLFFEEYLHSLYPSAANLVQQAQMYSLFAGGKRLRPNILFATLECYGFPVDVALPVAASIEMIHTYSLIHDDLPAMDNDDFRRGKPSCHKQYGEAVAILAGDGLLTRAFETVVKYGGENIVKIISEISLAAGDAGMIYGQFEDLTHENSTDVSIATLDNIHLHKTGCLFSLPLVLGGLISNNVSDIEVLREIGQKLGLAFQIQDDILDVTSTEQELGKSISDIKNAKVTYVSLLGVDKAKMKMKELYADATVLLKSLNFNSSPLEELFNSMVYRKN